MNLVVPTMPVPKPGRPLIQGTKWGGRKSGVAAMFYKLCNNCMTFILLLILLFFSRKEITYFDLKFYAKAKIVQLPY